jgi:hypothetical protein
MLHTDIAQRNTQHDAVCPDSTINGHTPVNVPAPATNTVAAADELQAHIGRLYSSPHVQSPTQRADVRRLQQQSPAPTHDLLSTPTAQTPAVDPYTDPVLHSQITSSNLKNAHTQSPEDVKPLLHQHGHDIQTVNSAETHETETPSAAILIQHLTHMIENGFIHVAHAHNGAVYLLYDNDTEQNPQQPRQLAVYNLCKPSPTNHNNYSTYGGY